MKLLKYFDAPSDLLAVVENFDSKLRRSLDHSHVCSDRLYIDVGKETCPPHIDPAALDGNIPSHDA